MERLDVVVLRTNPKDSSLARLLGVLTQEYDTLALIWDRTADYRCPVTSSRLVVRPSTRRGEYYRLSTVLTVASLQPWFLVKTLRARPRAVHAMDLDTGLVGLLAARLLRVPFVYQCLDPYAGSLPVGWPTVIGRVVNRIENAVISRSDLFVITDRKRLVQHGDARPRRVTELPNIPMRRLSPQPWATGDLTVGYVGSLVPHRSLDTIIDTVGELADQGVRLVMGGFGPLEPELRSRAASCVNVNFLGWVPDDEVMATMGAFDVFVQIEDPGHPAYRWVSPNKLFESMALGRPIIVATGTLAAARIEESGHGITVAYGDSHDLRRALLDLRDDVVDRRALGAAGRRCFVEQWAPARITRRVLDAYRPIALPVGVPARREVEL
jgi:glycosyltransferase involved in cell wall biosynthesis